MCGLAGVYFYKAKDRPFSHLQMSRLVNELLVGIEHRGTDATGIAAISEAGELHIEKADLSAGYFNKWRKELPEYPQTILCHTRYATQGTPMNLDNNHPIHYEDIIVTHNGHISNDDKIFRDEKLKRYAEVDSEAIAALFQRYGIDKAHIPLGKLDGNFAVAISDLRKPNTLLLAKGYQSPLHYYKTKHGIIWASEIDVIIKAIEEVFGTVIPMSKIDNLFFGELLLIEDGKVDKLDFEVYKDYPISKGWNLPKSNNNNQQKTLSVEDYLDRESKEEIEEDADWTDEIHPIAYTIVVSNKTLIFKHCDECEHSYEVNTMTEVGLYLFCKDCCEEFGEKNTPKEEEAHKVTCELVAEQFGTNPEFVNWVLFESEDDDFEVNDSILINFYVIFSDAYDKAYKELTGETDPSPSAKKAIEKEIKGKSCGVNPFKNAKEIGL
jgi:predicted glutamine amidotransferase